MWRNKPQRSAGQLIDLSQFIRPVTEAEHETAMVGLGGRPAAIDLVGYIEAATHNMRIAMDEWGENVRRRFAFITAGLIQAPKQRLANRPSRAHRRRRDRGRRG
jgi:hypothetical protein